MGERGRAHVTTRLGHALVCPPAESFAAGLTTVALGTPDLARARAQHARYCAALEELGLALVQLAPDERFPDSTFVEDAAVLVPGLAVITRPGAPSRLGETEAVEAALRGRFARSAHIHEPGTLDGGDVCEADGHVFIGVSLRTNEHGARQLAALLAQQGLTSALLDIRAVPGILHLKSGLAHPGKRDLVVIDALAAHPALETWHLLRVPRDEEYAANCVRVNERVLVPAGFPRVAELLERAGHAPLALDMSEFQKQDGGLSCLSLRW